MIPALPGRIRCCRGVEGRDQTGVVCNHIAYRDSALGRGWGAARSLYQTSLRITASSVMPSAARLGTSTAAPEARASIVTHSNGLSTKRGTIRSSFPMTPNGF
jgi:hypothetical protein